MQTFLPYPDFIRSATVLDWRRLGKQRSEALILLAGKWPNHPASKMWRGHEHSLARYGIAICSEWVRRGFNDTCLARFEHSLRTLSTTHQDLGNPAWIGQPDFHAAHRSNLLRKDREFYSRFNWDDGPDLPYLWP